MVTEARAGFTAFNDGTEGRPRGRLRPAAPEDRGRRAAGSGGLHDAIQPQERPPHERPTPRQGLARSNADQMRGTRCCGCAWRVPRPTCVDAAMIDALARGARHAPRQPRPARRADRPRRTALLVRRERGGAPPRALRRDAGRRCTRCSAAMLEWPKPILVARASGQCLGGGLELAAGWQPALRRAGSAVSASPRSSSACSLRRPRCCCRCASARRRAEDLLYSGRSIDGATAPGLGPRRTRLADDPAAAAAAYFDEHLSGKSAASLACAVHAAREPLAELVRVRLDGRRGAVSRDADGDARRERGPAAPSSRSGNRDGSTDEHPGCRRSAARRCSRTSSSTP